MSVFGSSQAEQDKPFHVRSSTGGFVSGYDTWEAASMDAERRNKAAKFLGLEVTYEVREVQIG